ncbi:FabD/lysophospholipase-like protein [Zopfia rhizophila CBS 207.26]|uniref:FabD/lysophospholipase-like protein n=1 Tax=Zopfia rhizophila CBS 207.26 TaxID=1314779 RepID=A0A6A6DJG4_9PEZI|nr:FabD/lysophospholipase-like protein [Zopfia rhizophila CBS 207.26]
MSPLLVRGISLPRFKASVRSSYTVFVNIPLQRFHSTDGTATYNDNRKIRNPSAPLRLLSLDGGGVRGLASLLVLERLMNEISLSEKAAGRRAHDDNTPLKPCHYFDMIGGTSTGGIIAVLLGRLRMDVPTCIQIYNRLSKVVFGKDYSVKMLGMKIPYRRTRFSSSVLEEAIKNVLLEQGFSKDERMWDDTLLHAPSNELNNLRWKTEEGLFEDSKDTDPHWSTALDSGSPGNGVSIDSSQRGSNLSLESSYPPIDVGHLRRLEGKVIPNTRERGCHTFVLAVYKDAITTPRLFTSFDPLDRETRIWQALRATTAAPFYFKEASFGTPRISYIDGGVGFNNPCAEVTHAAISNWESRTIGVIVSIGTGLQTIKAVTNRRWVPFGINNVPELAATATSISRVHHDMNRRYHRENTEYFRFDPDGLSKVSLEEWIKAGQISALAKRYLKRPSVEEKIQKCVARISKLSAEPATISIPASNFIVGVYVDGVDERSYPGIQSPIIEKWRMEEIDLDTRMPLGIRPPLKQELGADSIRPMYPFKEPEVVTDPSGEQRTVLPVAEDLDADGNPKEALVISFFRADNICVRGLVKDIPPGKYKIKYIVRFFDVQPHISDSSPNNPLSIEERSAATSKEEVRRDGIRNGPADPSPAWVNVLPPTQITFNAGKPNNSSTFLKRSVAVHISSDIVPFLLHHDAVGFAVRPDHYRENKGKGWIELESDEVDVDLGGTLGFVISKTWQEGKFIGGLSFGGVRLVPAS